MTIAIIVAAGSGLRFAGDRPKQFVEILGKPLIIHTLEKFQACCAIDSVVVVMSESGRAEFSRCLAQYPVSKLRAVVTGGPTRAASVWNGLGSLECSPDTVIAIHDGARPLVAVEDISRTVEEAKRTRAACLVAEVTDTIKHVEAGYISRTIDRERLRRALTPQCFRYEILRRAFEAAPSLDDVTDECSLVEQLGIPVAIVEGRPENFKITHPSDIAIAEAILSRELASMYV